MNDDEVLAIRTQDIARQLGIAPSTLDYWIKNDLCGPSIVASRSQRFQRYWSLQDAVVVRVVKTLRQYGMPLQRIAAARKELESKWNLSMSEVVMYWDGSDVLVLDSHGDVMALLKRSGQLAAFNDCGSFRIPVSRWLNDVAPLAEAVNVVDLQRRREERIERLNRNEPPGPSIADIRMWLDGND